ncbi:hypothetical protein CFR71_03445 [Novacetimonas pomaceti]|uniref:Tetrapyrrole biosynthesis uroporphyrinogen III synthase domain-containing protein n=1 Tax=Novacetimonas pomaceti TaxID=2021998 RepID=A0A318QA86_9PROT|nr:hypothetical protein CFR71_03445 [Novacetimonas pomaceti]
MPRDWAARWGAACGPTARRTSLSNREHPTHDTPARPAGGRVAVLVTRPPPGLAETMEAVGARGWLPVASPMLDIAALPLLFAPAPRPQAIILTSGQAVGAIARPDLLDVPCYAVGAATARRARDAGFAHVEMADEGTADGLGRMVAHDLSPAAGALLLAVGRGYGMELAGMLRDAGFRVQRRSVYRVMARGRLPARIASMIGGRADAVMFFSPRTAQAFMAALTASQRAMLRQVRAIVISERTAAVLEMGEWRSVGVASTPDSAGMLACLGNGPLGPVA